MKLGLFDYQGPCTREEWLAVRFIGNHGNKSCLIRAFRLILFQRNFTYKPKFIVFIVILFVSVGLGAVNSGGPWDLPRRRSHSIVILYNTTLCKSPRGLPLYANIEGPVEYSRVLDE